MNRTAKFISFIETNAATVLRLGISIVILWFSLQQFIHGAPYTAYVPDSIVALSHMSASTIVFFNALFELIFGLMLAFGWKIRIAALLLALHLFEIMYTVGYGEIGVRDFGLAVATLVIWMNGPDLFCIDQKKERVIIPSNQ